MSSCEIPTLETERLWLRPLCESDVDDYAALNADPEVMLRLGGPWDRGRSTAAGDRRGPEPPDPAPREVRGS